MSIQRVQQYLKRGKSSVGVGYITIGRALGKEKEVQQELIKQEKRVMLKRCDTTKMSHVTPYCTAMREFPGL